MIQINCFSIQPQRGRVHKRCILKTDKDQHKKTFDFLNEISKSAFKKQINQLQIQN